MKNKLVIRWLVACLLVITFLLNVDIVFAQSTTPPDSPTYVVPSNPFYTPDGPSEVSLGQGGSGDAPDGILPQNPFQPSVPVVEQPAAQNPQPAADSLQQQISYSQTTLNAIKQNYTLSSRQKVAFAKYFCADCKYSSRMIALTK
ncbi:MAG: hypothetical protein VB108_11315 [Anaerolineaceae bacterium]|nr:hypothetical protein [Anaerolineaceae bacterium]